MEIEIKELPKSKKEIKIKLSGEEFSPYFSLGAKEISKKMDISGFRPGKAPQRMVEEKTGAEKILNEAAKIALDKIIPQIIREKKLYVLGRPVASVQKLSREELEALIEVSVFPEIQLASWRDIVKKEPKNKVEVKIEEIEDSLKHLQRSRAKTIKKIGIAQKGDLIHTVYEIRSGGVKIENGDVKDHKFVIGEGKLLPGFEESLIGSGENETKEFSLKAPLNFWKKELRGKNLDFKVKVKGVFRLELPNIDDEWVRSLGEFNDLAHLKKSLSEGIRMEKQEAERRRWESKVLEKISQESKIDLPYVLVEKERDQILESFKARIESMGIAFNDYLTHIKKTLEDFKKDFIPEAEKRVKILLSLYQIAKEEKVNVTEEEIEEEKDKMFKKYPDIPKELQDKEKEINFKAYLKENLLRRKTIELLFREAG